MAYERRILAYVDIVGWSAACCSADPSVPAQVVSAMDNIHSVASQYSAEMKHRVAESPNALVHPKYAEVQWGAFSDNFVVSMPESFGLRLLIPVAEICRRLLRVGFLTRGAITVGDLYHVDTMVYGPALVQAVELEKEAVYPRLVVSPEASDLLDQIDTKESQTLKEGFCRQPLVSDHLGRTIVNLFAFGANIDRLNPARPIFDVADEIWGIRPAMAIIQTEIARLTEQRNEKHLEKWRYMRDVMWTIMVKPLMETGLSAEVVT